MGLSLYRPDGRYQASGFVTHPDGSTYCYECSDVIGEAESDFDLLDTIEEEEEDAFEDTD